MGSFFSSIAVLVFDVIRPGWRDELCGAVSILDSCVCTVRPSNNLFSLAAATVSATCPLNTLVDLGDELLGDCSLFDNGVYCAEDCMAELQGTAGLLTMELVFSTTLFCNFDKFEDFINDPIQPEFDAGGVTIRGRGDSAGNIQVSDCGPAFTTLSGNPVGNCRCDLTSCGQDYFSINCDAIGDWNGFNQCFPTSALL